VLFQTDQSTVSNVLVLENVCDGI